MRNNSKEIELSFNLPDFTREDINVRVSRNSVSVTARKKRESRVQRKDFFHEEKSQKAFSYRTSIPSVNPQKAKISFKGGVLKINVPKK